MTILYINTGSNPNAGDGDSLRTAFNKVNANFQYLSTASVSNVTTPDSYSPNNPPDWLGSPTVSTLSSGLDELASRVVAVEGNPTNTDVYKFQYGVIGTKDEPDTGNWGGSAIILDPGGESWAGVYIPSVAAQDGNASLNIYNNKAVGNNIVLTVNTGSFIFGGDGTLAFPVQSTNQRTGTGDALKFAKSSNQKVIATAKGTVDSPTVERLIIAGGDSYQDPETGVYAPYSEAGDIYLWAGRGANGGDIKVDAGDAYGENTEAGGTIKVRGGYSTTGRGGFVEISAGYSNQGQGGDVSIKAGGGTTAGTINLYTYGNTVNNWQFNPDGITTLPAGGTITEGVVTSNPTIQLTPATPAVASQKLVIKGGGNYNAEANGIALNWYVITAQVGETITIYVYSLTNANQTLYWWITPAGAGISDPDTGTVTIGEGGGGDFSFALDSDDYEFTVRVSPTDNVYDPATTGVETLVFNEAAPSFGNHHLHLTTGDLTETSIFLGTDDHNVRTTVDGSIQITTPNVSNNIWQFGADGGLTLPSGSPILFGNGNSRIQAGMGFHINSEEGISLEAVDVTDPQNPIYHGWYFGLDGSLTFPDSTVQTTAFTDNGAELVGAGTAQVGSSLTIATNDGGTLGGWGSQALAVVYNAEIISTYAVGSAITWQDGTTATITGIDNYGPTYIDIFWDTPKTGDLFPITLKTSNYVAASPVTARITAAANQWTFDADGSLTLPGSMTIETTYGGSPTLVIDGKGSMVDIRSTSTILIGFNNSSGNVFIGDQNSGQVDILGPKFRVFAAAPATSTGAVGDQAGQVAFDNSYIYHCIADYNQLGHQVTIAEDYLGRTSLNTNEFQLTKTADTLQITVGDTISDSDGGATSTVVSVTSDDNYTYVGTGGFAYAATFPLTFTSTDYVSGGNIWKRVAWSVDTW